MPVLYLDIYRHIASTSVSAYRSMLAVPEFARSTLNSARWQRHFTVQTVLSDRTEWRLCGLLHYDGAPAVVYACGRQDWYQHGKLHRDGAPAIVRANTTVEYWQHGVYVPA
jgi:hypothetical protein